MVYKAEEWSIDGLLVVSDGYLLGIMMVDNGSWLTAVNDG